MGNCRPKKDNVEKTITYTPSLSGLIGGISFGAAPANFTFTKKYWYEVEPVSNTRKFIQNGRKQETMTSTTVKIPSGETNDGDVTFINQTFTQQKYVSDANGNVEPVFDRECRGDHAYDENYFYHIFEWPTSHSLSRSVGGFQSASTTSTTGNTAPVGEPSNSTTTGTAIYSTVSTTVTGSLSLSKVDATVSGVNADSIVYYGGTDDNKIFFTYNTSSATDVVVRVGDVINGWTVSKVVNFIIDKALRKRVTDASKKNKTPSFVYVGSKTGIVVGDGVQGKGIPTGTTVTAISSTDNKISLSNAIKTKKLKTVLFTSPAINKVNLSTVCYAELSSGSAPFVADTVYTATGSGASIEVKSGKGITNRSAVVGMYFSTSKKLYEYTPIFYDKSTDCEQTLYKEKEATYVIGTITLNDGTEFLTGQYLCTNPHTKTASIIHEIYWTTFGMPVDKTKLLYWIDRAAKEILSNTKLEELIIDDVKSALNGKTPAKVVDDVCGNDVTQEQINIYNPYKELSYAQGLVNSLSEISYDPCVLEKSPSAYTAEELKQVIANNIQGAISSSYIRMPEEMYKQFVTNDNSLMNNIMRAIDSIEASIPDKKIETLPPSIKGENKSSVELKFDKFRRLPPKFSRVDYLISDFTFVDDKDIDISDASNKTELTISSIPRWTGTISVGGIAGDDVTTDTGIRVVTSRTNGYITSIDTSAGTPPPPPIPTIPTGGSSSSSASWLAPTSGDDPLEARPYPFNVWSDTVNYQKSYSKLFWFRIEESSDYLGECLNNRGNPFLDNPVYAKLTSKLSESATTINVDSTTEFLSSGYLIIPKYLEKKEKSNTGNIDSYFYYLGEEIIYYNSKTSTSFTNCTRGVYETSAIFEQVVTAGDFIEDVMYVIKTLGNTNWQSIGAPDGANVGTIFTASGLGSGTGDAYTFESTMTPFESAPEINAVIHSYDKGFKVAQFWPYKTL